MRRVRRYLLGLVGAVLAAGGISFVVWQRAVTERSAAVATLLRLGARIDYEEGLEADSLDLGWIGRTFGIDAVADVQAVDLSHCNVQDSHLGLLLKFSRLHRLDLAVTPVTGVGVAQLAELSELEHLGLFNTHVRDVGVVPFGAHQNLQSLDVGHTDISDAAVRAVSTCPRLRVLNLNKTVVTDESLKALKEANDLRELYVFCDDLTAAAIQEFVKLRPECRVFSQHISKPEW